MAERLYLYPNLHPSSRQSQLDFLAEPDHKKFPLSENIEVMQVTLGPGEILYLPPFWFHRVIAEELSISVSTWCDSEEIQVYYDTIQTAPLPFQAHWSTEQFGVALQLFVKALIEGVVEEPARSMFVQRLIEQRYLSLFGQEKSVCISSCDDPRWDSFKQELREHMEPRVKQLVKDFKQLQQYSQDKHILFILLGNYVELVVEYVVGVENVNSFLQTCLSKSCS